LIQGTIAGGAEADTGYQAVGSLYPDLGMVILNPDKLDGLLGTVGTHQLNDPSSSWSDGFARMPNVLFESIKLGAQAVSFKSRVTEYVPARHYFIRIKNQDFNYSNNPTFVISSADEPDNPQDIGKLRFVDFYSNPKVYNDNNDLIAVAKLSQPLLKDFTNECLVKIKIDV
jgi:hypothetical protein